MEKTKAEKAKIPRDLTEALKKNKTAWNNFQKFTLSYKTRYLIWISGPKKPDTRRKRVDEAVLLISRNVKSLLK
jgi:uncharacterized protein YdeI (YjbR/CyaY-like superfamily)